MPTHLRILSSPLPSRDRRLGLKPLLFAWCAVIALVPSSVLAASVAPAGRHAAAVVAHAAPAAAPDSIHASLPRGVRRQAAVLTSAPSSVSAPASVARTALPRTTGTTPATFARFNGLANDGAAKPDANVAAGPGDLIEIINPRWAAFSKTGTLLSTTTLGSWYGFASSAGMFDVRVIYDATSGHYVMINLRYTSSGIGYVDLSASTTASATGQWCQYHILVQDGTNQPDFPGLGSDGRAVYITMNMYPTGSNTFQYAKLLVIDAAQLVGCASSVSMSTFTNLRNPDGSLAQSVQPAQTLDAEPAEYLADVSSKSGSKVVTVWTLTNPLSSPTLTNASVTVGKYAFPPNAPQGGTSSLIYTGGQPLLQVAVRSGKLWTAHTTAFTVNSIKVTAAQWFELDPTQLAVVQQQIHFVNGTYLYMPAITATSDGSEFMVYDVSNAGTYVSAKYSSRQASDTVGTLPSTSLIQSGLAAYVRNSGASSQAWGDFFSAAVDASDTTKAWLCAEYASTNNQWATMIAEVGY